MDAVTLRHFQTPASMSKTSHTGTGMFGSNRDHVWSDHVDFIGLASFLRRVHPIKTAQSVAADTGLPVFEGQPEA